MRTSWSLPSLGSGTPGGPCASLCTIRNAWDNAESFTCKTHSRKGKQAEVGRMGELKLLLGKVVKSREAGGSSGVGTLLRDVPVIQE